MRLNKKLASAGLCSRREADRLIESGKVKLNGKVVEELGVKVQDSDIIEVDGKKISSQKQERRVWLYHKPRGVIVSCKDDFERPIIYDFLPKNLPRVIYVGRLDMDSEGLLLLTNDSEFARNLELPSNNYVRVYKARVYGEISQRALEKISNGVTVSGMRYKKCKIELTKQNNKNSWLRISLYEGKNREVRKLMEHIGLKVSRLIRVQYGPYMLDDLAEGMVKEQKAIL